MPARRVNRSTVSRETIRRPSSVPPPSAIRANRATSPAVAKRPACGATPPIANAFSSCTSPRTTRPRHGSSSVGAIRPRSSGPGRKIVSSIPSGAKTRRRTKLLSGSPAARSSASPSRMNPRSLYSERLPGGYSSPIRAIASTYASRPRSSR